MAKILLSGRRYSYTINRKSTSSLSLRLRSATAFVVTCHYLTPQFLITNFINSHVDWILKHSSRFRPSVKISSLKKLSILGNDYQLIISRSVHDSVVIFEEDKKIYLNATSLSSLHLKKLLDHKLRPLALKLINSELQELSRRYSFNYGRVSVRNQTSRFGSCSTRGNLNFNWQIILFPFDQFRHILLHELTHLSIKNHSVSFWRQLTVYDPHARANNLWLRQVGSRLLIFS